MPKKSPKPSAGDALPPSPLVPTREGTVRLSIAPGLAELGHQPVVVHGRTLYAWATYRMRDGHAILGGASATDDMGKHDGEGMNLLDGFFREIGEWLEGPGGQACFAEVERRMDAERLRVIERDIAEHQSAVLDRQARISSLQAERDAILAKGTSDAK